MQPLGKESRQPSPQATMADQFRASMVIDREKWHDGLGYDVDLIRKASPADRAAIEQLLLVRPVEDWRDVEALAVLDSAQARTALRRALRHRDHRVRMAVVRYAPQLVSETQRTALLVAALKDAEFYGGLTEALELVVDHHPPQVVSALLCGLRRRDGETAVHFAAMVLFLHGGAAEPFDWNQRPFFLRFNTENDGEREAAIRELCARIGVDPTEATGA